MSTTLKITFITLLMASQAFTIYGSQGASTHSAPHGKKHRAFKTGKTENWENAVETLATAVKRNRKEPGTNPTLAELEAIEIINSNWDSYENHTSNASNNNDIVNIVLNLYHLNRSYLASLENIMLKISIQYPDQWAQSNRRRRNLWTTKDCDSIEHMDVLEERAYATLGLELEDQDSLPQPRKEKNKKISVSSASRATLASQRKRKLAEDDQDYVPETQKVKSKKRRKTQKVLTTQISARTTPEHQGNKISPSTSLPAPLTMLQLMRDGSSPANADNDVDFESVLPPKATAPKTV